MVSTFCNGVKFSITLTVLCVVVIVVHGFARPGVISGRVNIGPLFALITVFTKLEVFNNMKLILFPLVLVIAVGCCGRRVRGM